jgi:hypothetical protein|tara:strand:+ start:15857 stop:16147 length:291 start_codon:yes stop_codon:yes gene_type:complete
MALTKLGHVAGCGDIANSFHGKDHVYCEERQDYRSVHAEFESVYPNEGYRGSGVDAAAVEVAGRACDDATNEQTDNNCGRFHDGSSKALANNDGDD